jgi:hypothetical protein
MDFAFKMPVSVVHHVTVTTARNGWQKTLSSRAASNRHYMKPRVFHHLTPSPAEMAEPSTSRKLTNKNMKSETTSEVISVFPRMAAAAMSGLKNQLLEDYEEKYPGLGEIIRLVVDEEEAHAWKLSAFPHLFLPDLVEEHIARLGLEPADTRHEIIFPPRQSPFLALAAAC